MYQSKLFISPKSGKILEKYFLELCQKHDFVYCRALKRKVSLGKLPYAITLRKESATWRMKRFPVALEILQFEKKYQKRNHNGYVEYELSGHDRDGKKVVIHLREETTQGKDRILYFISCY